MKPIPVEARQRNVQHVQMSVVSSHCEVARANRYSNAVLGLPPHKISFPSQEWIMTYSLNCVFISHSATNDNHHHHHHFIYIHIKKEANAVHSLTNCHSDRFSNPTQFEFIFRGKKSHCFEAWTVLHRQTSSSIQHLSIAHCKQVENASSYEFGGNFSL